MKAHEIIGFGWIRIGLLGLTLISYDYDLNFN